MDERSRFLRIMATRRVVLAFEIWRAILMYWSSAWWSLSSRFWRVKGMNWTLRVGSLM